MLGALMQPSPAGITVRRFSTVTVMMYPFLALKLLGTQLTSSCTGGNVHILVARVRLVTVAVPLLTAFGASKAEHHSCNMTSPLPFTVIWFQLPLVGFRSPCQANHLQKTKLIMSSPRGWSVFSGPLNGPRKPDLTKMAGSITDAGNAGV